MAENQIGRNIAFKIYNADGTEFEGLVLHKATFETVVMSLGDKVTGDVYYKDNGLAVTMQEYIVYNGVKYILVNPPTIIREGMVSDNSELKGMTRYSFVFYHPMCLLGNFPFTDVAVSTGQQKYLPQNKTFSWIGNLVDFVAKLNKNLEGTEWVCEIGDTVTSEIYNKLSDVLSFDKQTIADVIKTGYDTWKVPYIVDVIASTDSRYASGKRFLVRYGLPSQEIVGSGGNPFVFEFGKGVGLKNNSRTPKNNKIITRIAGYGSENNIPYGYPQIVWTGDQSWNYTINNSSSEPNSYPIYDGIVNGQRVRLIKHPFTRNHLMPSIYSDTVNKKVNPNATGYDPNIEIKDYYDAVSTQEYTYPNPINPSAPSYEIHEFEEIKPELGQAAIAGVSAYDLEHQGAISIDDAQSLLLDYYSESHNETEKIQLNRLIFNLPTATELSGHSDAASYHYDWSLKSDAYYAYIKYTSSILNFTCIVLRAAQPPAPTWDDTMDDDGNYKQSYFKITLPQLSFDLYACAAITQEMSINMRSGACIGCTFPVMVDWDDYKKNFYDADGNFDPVIGEGHPRDGEKYPNSASGQITVIVQKDNSTFGTLMPNVYQNPTANDQFVILGISLPLSYVSNAESRLDDEMIQYMKDNNVYYFEYPLKFDEHFLATHTDILQQMKCNTIVRFKYNGVTIPLYIKQMSIKWGVSPLPQYDITLTDDIQVVLNPIGKAVETFRTMIDGGGGNIDLNALYANLDERYLSKMNDDTAAGFVRLLRGLQVGERFVTGLLGEGGVFRTESDGTTYLEVDKMYVRMKAYFDTVEIRKFLHSNGNRIASLAGIKCSRVEYIDANGDVTEDATQATKYRCYFRANNNGETVTNDFVIGDLAFCKETNAQVGTGVEQHGYWRAVVGKNTLLTDEGEAWIDLSASDCLDGSDIPLAQDDIVQLGNKTDTTRQGAIIEYVGGADAPSYQIYQNINTYSLENKNYVAMGYNSSTGRAYLNVYGDFRFGSKNDSGSYLSYNAQTGILNVKAVINAQSTIGNQSIDQYIKAHQNNYDDSWIQPALDAIQEQIDGELDTWYYSGVPTLNNLPASQWTTDALKKEHVGDLYYDKDSGLAYRFIYDNDTQQYRWTPIHDDAISEALKIANQAQDTADNKRRVFICDAQHPTPTPPYDEGDLWVNVKYPFETGALYKDDILKCINTRATGTFNIADWSKASNYTDDSALLNFVNTTYAQDLQNIGTQIDKKAETWYQDTDPSLETGWVDAEHVGDIWCDTSANGGKKTYIYQQREGVTPAQYYWAEQAVPKAVFDEIDGKVAIYVGWEDWGENLKLKDLFIPSSTTSQGGVTYYADKVYRCIDTTTPLFQEINYTDDTTVKSIIQRYGQILNITPTAQSVGEALGYLEKVLSTGTTSIDGGIVLTNILYMKDTATTPSIKSGISGLAQTVEECTGYKGYGTAAWYGGGVNNGIPIDHEASPTLGNYAKSLFRFDGSGYVAGGNITWNANGAVTIKNITTLSDSQNTNLLNELATFNNAFTFATSGQGSTTVLSITPNVPFTALSILENNVTNAVATQAWVRQNATGTFWGNAWTLGGSVVGSLTGVVQINMTGHLIMHSGSTGIYLNSDGTGIDWHNASNEYVKTMLAFTNENNIGLITAIQQLYIPSTSSLKIGDAIFEWDASNNAVKVHHANGANVAVNFYATGGVSALGYSDSGGGGGGGDVTWDLLANNTDTRPIALSHLTTALTGYATTSQLAGYLPLTGGVLSANNTWLSPARLQLLRYDTTAYTDRACIGITDGNLHIDSYPEHSVYLNFYSGSSTVYVGAGNGATYVVYHSGNLTNVSQLTNDAGYITSASLSGYLPLAGGTMNAGSKILTSSSGVDAFSGAIEIRELSYVAENQYAWDYSPAMTFHWANRYVVRFGLRSDGSMAFNDQPILHSGNWSSYVTYANLNASSWTVEASRLLFVDNQIVYGRSGLQFQQISGNQGTDPTLAQNPSNDWWSHLIMNHGNSSGYYVDLAFNFYTDDVKFRHIVAGTGSDWKSIITSSNIASQSVASATKLQTARTLWGQLFDGSANVSGNISGVGDILPASNYTYTIGTSTNEFKEADIRQIWARHLEGGRAWGGAAELYIQYFSEQNTYINPNGGNVGIGTASPAYKLDVNGQMRATSLIKAGGTSSQFLKADGSVDNNLYLSFKGLRSDIDSIYSLRYNFGSFDVGDYGGQYAVEYPSNYGLYFSLAFDDNNTGAILAFDTPAWSSTLGHVYVRTRGAGTVYDYSSWGTLAYITDNVASATKLQTARTIWGQSFDGTTNVSGAISGATTISASSNVSVGGALVVTGATTHTDSILYKKDASLKIYSAVGAVTTDYEAVAIQSCIDDVDPETSSGTYVPSNLPARCVIALQPRGGFVGVGTTTPSYTLHVNGTTGLNNTLYIKGSGGWCEGIRIQNADNGWTTIILGASGASGTNAYAWSFHTYEGNFYLNRNGSNDHTGYELCNVSGNWGISTTSPAFKLDVAGTTRTTGQLTIGGGTAVLYAQSWDSGIVIGADGHDKVVASYLASNTGGAVVGAHNSSLTAWAALNVCGSPVIFRNMETECARIHTNGYFGIGTTTPSYKLHVAGTMYASNDSIFDGNVTTTSIELNARGTLSGYGGFIDFHYNGSSADYTTRLIEDTNDVGILSIWAKNTGGTSKLAGLRVGSGYDGSFVQIGNAVLKWDSYNNAIRVELTGGGAVNLYTTGGLSALGISGAADGTVNASLIPSTTGTYSLGNTSYRWKELYLADANGNNGKIYSDYDGINLDSVNGGYFDGSRYIITGRLVVGTSDDSDQPNYDLYVSGNTYVDGSNSYFYGNVSVQSLTQRSDMRIKDVISDLNLRISTIAQAPLFKYKLKQGDGTIMVGSSAQYWDALLPEVIHRDAEGILGLDYGVTALASVISVAKEVTEHERRIARLEAENAILRAQIEDLKAA